MSRSTGRFSYRRTRQSKGRARLEPANACRAQQRSCDYRESQGPFHVRAAITAALAMAPPQPAHLSVRGIPEG